MSLQTSPARRTTARTVERPSREGTPRGGKPSRGYDQIARYFDDFAAVEDTWLHRTGAYQTLVTAIYRALVPPGQRVLEIGCGRGDLLAALEPSYGLGVDVSGAMVAAAGERHPHLDFERCAGEELWRAEQFDYIVLSDLVPYVHDLHALLCSVAVHSHPATRIVVSTYSSLWRPPLAVLTSLGLRPKRPVRNWVAPMDLVNLAQLAGLEVVTARNEILVPTRSRMLSRIANGFLARLPGVRALALTHWLVLRPSPKRRAEAGVSVIVPCRNESGSIAQAVERIPEMGRETEIIFVEGGSTDDTRARIEQEVAKNSDRSLRFVAQTAKGKWNAVQDGFAAARNEVLMILDGDLTVAPEDLPKFYDALVSGRGELITGSRLVYGMEPGAMRFLNMLGNRFFAGLLSFILGQYVKDTLCGTKVLYRADYERMQRRRGEFGAEDPFGDFDLLLGATLLGLKVVNLPVRYAARVYGDTNIQRFSCGGRLLRLSGAGYRRIWVAPLSGELYRSR